MKWRLPGDIQQKRLSSHVENYILSLIAKGIQGPGLQQQQEKYLSKRKK